jgi:DNA-binding transcriptional MerR regulator
MEAKLNDDYELLTTGQVAREFGVSRTSVVAWHRKKKLPAALRTPDSRRLFYRRDVEAFRRNRERSQKRSA